MEEEEAEGEVECMFVEIPHAGFCLIRLSDKFEDLK